MIKSLLCTHRSYPAPNTGEDDRLRGGTRPLPMSPAHYLFVRGVYFGVYLPVEVRGGDPACKMEFRIPLYQRPHIFEAPATEASRRIMTMGPLLRPVGVDCVSNHG